MHFRYSVGEDAKQSDTSTTSQSKVAKTISVWRDYAHGLGFGNTTQLSKTVEALKSVATLLVGFELSEDKRNIRRLHDKAQLDLNGLAKGYGIDKMYEALESIGIQNALIEWAGDVRALGCNPNGCPWSIVCYISN